ncbi:MAG TPA: hypothetical protein VGO59_18975 [Verrucomicrobiae bacterium]
MVAIGESQAFIIGGERLSLVKAKPEFAGLAAVWSQLLLRPEQEIASILTAETDEGQRLRQNSPFVGALNAREVWGIKSDGRGAERLARLSRL